ncbi:hypothetical protein U9608_001491 [Vibrio alginolyticus]|uniref:hypothetical protein n=1 Tax=Vibrio harveyi group TaxID=717610 RepID=UPI002AFCB480|nr:hypothetical protein [Vibrio alginolyticus]
MAIYCVTYDLKTPGKNYESVHNYLEKFNHCKKLESFWLIDTTKNAADIRDDLDKLVDGNDIIFVAELQKHWASTRYPCATWLKDESRNWG